MEVLGSLKAETLRTIMRDIGEKDAIGRREDMIEALKHKLTGTGAGEEDIEEEVVIESRTTRSTRASGANSVHNQKPTNGTKKITRAAQKSISAPTPTPTRSSRKRKVEEDEVQQADEEEETVPSNSGKRTRGSRRQNNVSDADRMDVDESISAAPQRGKRTAATAPSSSGPRTRAAQNASAEPRRGRSSGVAISAPLSTRRQPKKARSPSVQVLSDADVDGTPDEEEAKPISRRGRPRKGIVEKREDEPPLKRITRTGGASISAPVPRTPPPAKRVRVPPSTPLSPRQTRNSSRPPHSTRSRTIGSPAKKPTYIAAPLVKRTYGGNARKGNIRNNSRASTAASSAARRSIRKPRSSVSKPQPKTSIKAKPVSRAKAKSRSRKKVDIQETVDAGAIANSRQFDGVELIVPRKRQGEALGVNGEVSSSSATGAVAGTGSDGIESKDKVADADGESDADLVGQLIVKDKSEPPKSTDENMANQEPPPESSPLPLSEILPTMSSQPGPALGIGNSRESSLSSQQSESLRATPFQPGSPPGIEHSEGHAPSVQQSERDNSIFDGSETGYAPEIEVAEGSETTKLQLPSESEEGPIENQINAVTAGQTDVSAFSQSDLPSTHLEQEGINLVEEVVRDRSEEIDQERDDVVLEEKIELIVSEDNPTYDDRDRDGSEDKMDGQNEDASHLEDMAITFVSQTVEALPSTGVESEGQAAHIQAGAQSEVNGASHNDDLFYAQYMQRDEAPQLELDEEELDGNDDQDIMNPRMEFAIEIDVQQQTVVVSEDVSQSALAQSADETQVEGQTPNIEPTAGSSASATSAAADDSFAQEAETGIDTFTTSLPQSPPSPPDTRPLPTSGFDTIFSTSVFTKASIDSLRSLNTRPAPSDIDNEMFENTYSDDEDEEASVHTEPGNTLDRDRGDVLRADDPSSWLDLDGAGDNVLGHSHGEGANGNAS